MSNSVIGTQGTVTVRTRGPHGPGEVDLGAPGCHMAWSKDPIEKGQQVLVTATRGIRTVEVVPWG